MRPATGIASGTAVCTVVCTVLLLGLVGCGGDAASTTTAATGTVADEVAAGREVFLSAGCGTCHTLSAAGTTGAVGTDLDQGLLMSAEAAGAPLAEFVRTSIVDPDSWVIPQFSSGVMPTNYGSELSEQELDDLVAFIVDSVEQPSS